jgi:hypothetical protein
VYAIREIVGEFTLKVTSVNYHRGRDDRPKSTSQQKLVAGSAVGVWDPNHRKGVPGTTRRWSYVGRISPHGSEDVEISGGCWCPPVRTAGSWPGTGTYSKQRVRAELAQRVCGAVEFEAPDRRDDQGKVNGMGSLDAALGDVQLSIAYGTGHYQALWMMKGERIWQPAPFDHTPWRLLPRNVPRKTQNSHIVAPARRAGILAPLLAAHLLCRRTARSPATRQDLGGGFRRVP